MARAVRFEMQFRPSAHEETRERTRRAGAAVRPGTGTDTASAPPTPRWKTHPEHAIHAEATGRLPRLVATKAAPPPRSLQSGRFVSADAFSRSGGSVRAISPRTKGLLLHPSPSPFQTSSLVNPRRPSLPRGTGSGVLNVMKSSRGKRKYSLAHRDMVFATVLSGLPPPNEWSEEFPVLVYQESLADIFRCLFIS